jgi:predicted amidohydrolase YtcJ
VGPRPEVIDLNGATAIPGFIEGHGHFMGVGQFKRSLNLRDATNWKQIVSTVGAAAKEAKPGEWIIGRGFHQSKMDGDAFSGSARAFPVHDDLSAASPANPVLLTHASGHASMANAKAMELAGVTRDTKDPSGGEILRDVRGNPTGLMNETAQGLIRKAYGEYLRTAPSRSRKKTRRSKRSSQPRKAVRPRDHQFSGCRFVLRYRGPAQEAESQR